MRNDRYILVVLALFSGILAGCASWSAITTLKDFASNNKNSQDYVNKQDDGFELLLLDVDNGVLRKGAVRKNIVSRYGDPVAATSCDDGNACAIEALYRRPLDYIGGDKVYLYFDEFGVLVDFKSFRSNRVLR